MKEEQKIMLGILEELHRICEENQISYWICSGTLLGAVRHKGFIPWDDDIDVSMKREDFEKFKEIAPSLIRNDIYLEITDLNEMIKNMPLKIRHKYSEYVEKWDNPAEIKKGIYIDIFPFDKFSFNKKKRFLEMLPKYLYELKTTKIWKKSSKIRNYIKKTIMFILKLIPNKYIIKKNKQYLELSKKKGNNYLLGFGYGLTWRTTFLENEIFPLIDIEFEGSKFKAPCNYDVYLTKLYGQYMKLPKIENRETHAKYIKIFRKWREE